MNLSYLEYAADIALNHGKEEEERVRERGIQDHCT